MVYFFFSTSNSATPLPILIYVSTINYVPYTYVMYYMYIAYVETLCIKSVCVYSIYYVFGTSHDNLKVLCTCIFMAQKSLLLGKIPPLDQKIATLWIIASGLIPYLHTLWGEQVSAEKCKPPRGTCYLDTQIQGATTSLPVKSGLPYG